MIKYIFFIGIVILLFSASCTDRTPIFNILSDYNESSTDNLTSTQSIGGEYTNTLYADVIVEAPGVINPEKAVNGVRGAGQGTGGLDVCQLNYTIGNGNYIIIRWSNKIVLNGTGADFVIFENGFEISGQPGHFFMDLAVVSVSRDGSHWIDFPYDYTYSPETTYSDIPDYWIGFAGKTPVLYNEDSNRVNPFNKTEAGGDQFDLSDLPDTSYGLDIKNNGFKYLKITTAPSLINNDTGTNFVKDGMSNGADIDGVYARYFKNE